MVNTHDNFSKFKIYTVILTWIDDVGGLDGGSEATVGVGGGLEMWFGRVEGRGGGRSENVGS